MENTAEQKSLTGTFLPANTVGVYSQSTGSKEMPLTKKSIRSALFIFAIAAGTVSILRAQTNDPMPSPVRYSFEYYDINSNGILDPEELSHYVFTRWDRDTDGYLGDIEWQSAVPGWHEPFTDTDIHDYSYWDKDSDGHLRSDEVEIMLKDTNLLFLWDVNNDGVVDKKELADALVRIHQHDENLVGSYEWKIFLD